MQPASSGPTADSSGAVGLGAPVTVELLRPRRHRPRPPTGLRIGVLCDAPLETVSVDPACKAAVDTTIRTLESAGHQIVDAPIPLPSADELLAPFTTIWNVSVAGVPFADPDAIEPHNRALRDAARNVDSWTYAQAVPALLNCRPLAVFTSLCNVTGLPAISVPIHHDNDTGLPVGIQIVAPPWREDLLLRVARSLELTHPWTDRHPELYDTPSNSPSSR